MLASQVSLPSQPGMAGHLCSLDFIIDHLWTCTLAPVTLLYNRITMPTLLSFEAVVSSGMLSCWPLPESESGAQAALPPSECVHPKEWSRVGEGKRPSLVPNTCWHMSYSCMDLSIRVHFLYSGKATLIWAGVLSGMSPIVWTKGKTVFWDGLVHTCSVPPLRTSTAELRKHKLSFH